MLSDPQDLFFTSSDTPMDLCSDGTYLYTVSTTKSLKKFSLSSFTQVGSSVTVGSSTPTGICLLNGVCAVVVNQGAQVNYVELSTGYVTTRTTNALATANTVSTCGQQVATVGASAMATTSTLGKLQVITLNFISQISPTSVSGALPTVVIAKESTGAAANRWICGTNNGKVTELDSAGNVIKTILLPTTPNVGTAPSQVVTGLSHYPPNLAVTTAYGLLYIYEYESSNLLYTQRIVDGQGTSGSYAGTILCASVSGHTLLGHGRAGGQGEQSFTEIFFDAQNPVYSWYKQVNSQRLISLHINPQSQKGFLTNSSPSDMGFRSYNISGISKTTEATECQNPPGVRVPGRIIRLRDQGIGQICVEADTNIPDTPTNVICSEGCNYIEIAIIDDGGTDKWDIREFSK